MVAPTHLFIKNFLLLKVIRCHARLPVYNIHFLSNNIITMYTQSLKPVLMGIVIGLILFAMPFLILKTLLFFLLVGGIIRFFKGRRWYGRYRQPGLHPAFTDTIRHMKEEEYQSFRQTISGDYHHRREIPIREVE